MERKNIGVQTATQKIRRYCAYQERNHREVRGKLFNMGLSSREADEVIAGLINENFLNEERYAIAFAGGKFRMLHWGKIKIRYVLKQKGISDYCIKKGLQQIDCDDYYKTLVNLAEKKYPVLKGTILVKQLKLKKYLSEKGFEQDLINDVVKNLIKE